MAQAQVSPVLEVNFLEPGRDRQSSATGYPALAHALLSVSDMDAILLASPFSLSQTRVDSLSALDKQYTIKAALDAGTISNTDLLPPIVTDTSDPVAEVHRYGTVWRNTVSGDVFQTTGDGDWLLIVDL